MNRIILIGNGFDLAHGLPTSYKIFLDNYWKRKSDKIGKETSSVYDDYEIKMTQSEGKSWSECWKPSSDQIRSYYDFKEYMYTVQHCYPKNSWDFFKYYNKFLEKITNKKSSLNNWIDIEEEYYALLKECSLSKKGIDGLNQDFNQIKTALETYLKEDVNDKLSDKSFDFPFVDIKEKIYSDFKKNDFKEKTKSVDFTSPNSILFLNFNYTSTIQYYLTNKKHQTKIESIYIHGKLDRKDNPIIFGYGDDISDDYKLIENLNDKRYLENIKSVKYLETDNLKRLLSFINSDNYQIFIFGHSCGNSDRTLLKTLFEHSNCASIKVFYYIQKDGTCNYTDIIQNISHHFTDKAMMRDKVVNKTYSEPLRNKIDT
jgi:hypothetical protein